MTDVPAALAHIDRVQADLVENIQLFLQQESDEDERRPTTVILALAGLIVTGVAAGCAQTRLWLWIAGCGVGVFVGPVQSSSRSLMARMAPSNRQAEYFGLFTLSSKVTAFAGPTLAAVVTEVTGSQRIGLATILAFLAAGFLLLAGPWRDGHA
jgi:MFS-type transporter involved in bile tolerance (Atg22 family)